MISVCSVGSVLMIVAALSVGCGKQGPPLPPLVLVPKPPADFTAARRGDKVDLQFTVPAANTNNSHPANIDRVDVYGFTGPTGVTDADLLKYGTRVGSVDVKAPRDPEATADPDESESDVEPPAGEGLDQGAPAHVEEQISPDTLRPVVLGSAGHGRAEATDEDRPLLGPAAAPPSRTYVSVGITTRGRKGPLSKRIAVPLVPPPTTPAAPTITYTETAVTVTWASAVPAGTTGSVLPSRPLATSEPTFGYNVYEVVAAKADAKPQGQKPENPPGETRLTNTPVATPGYSDSRMTFGAERCYVVRTVETLGGATIESAASPRTCVKLVDTFPPASPKGLTAVASGGAISLIWEANTETDFAGYIVLRGTAPGDLKPITPAPVLETTFRDGVQAGVRFFYAVEAVDRTGNASAPSNTVEETAR